MTREDEAAQKIQEALNLIGQLNDETPGFGVYLSIENQLNLLRDHIAVGEIKLEFIKSLTIWRLAARELEEIPRDNALKLAHLIYGLLEVLDPE